MLFGGAIPNLSIAAVKFEAGTNAVRHAVETSRVDLVEVCPLGAESTYLAPFFVEAGGKAYDKTTSESWE